MHPGVSEGCSRGLEWTPSNHPCNCVLCGRSSDASVQPPLTLLTLSWQTLWWIFNLSQSKKWKFVGLTLIMFYACWVILQIFATFIFILLPAMFAIKLFLTVGELTHVLARPSSFAHEQQSTPIDSICRTSMALLNSLFTYCSPSQFRPWLRCRDAQVWREP